MVNTKNTVNPIILFFFFVVVAFSFYSLIKGSRYNNLIIFVLAVSSFLLGYLIRKKNDNVGGSNPENISTRDEIPKSKKIPQEFLDEQEKFGKLSLEDKERMVV